MTRQQKFPDSMQGRLLLVACVLAGVVAVYWETFARIVAMWSFSDYQYGWLVYPLCLYLLIAERKQLAQARLRPSKRGAALTIAVIFVWLIAKITGTQVVEFFSITFLIFAASLAILGTAATRVIAFPLLFLMASVPVGAFLVEPLMEITAEISALLLHLIGIPALREGQFFYLPGGSFEVADVCSGLRYLLAGGVAALAFSYLTFESVSRRLLFVGLCAIVLVITNGVRAFIVMAIASATEMRVFGGYDHVIFGMVMFAVVFLALIWLGSRHAEPRQENAQSKAVQTTELNQGRSVAIVIVTVMALIAGPNIASGMLNRDAVMVTNQPLPVLPGCEVTAAGSSEEAPRFINADMEVSGIYQCLNHQVAVYVASYGVQQQGKELINSSNRVWPKEWRRFLDKTPVEMPTRDGSAKVQQLLVRHPSGWRSIRYWYQVGNTVTSSPVRAKFMEAFRTLMLQSTESSVVIVSVVSEDSENRAELEAWVSSYSSELMRWNHERMQSGGGRSE